MSKEINNIPLKSADTRMEQALLGFLDREAKRIGYGRITIELVVHQGEVTHLDCYQEKISVNLHNENKRSA